MRRRTSGAPVDTVEDEDRAMGSCSCSGRWKLAGEAVRPVRGRWLDRLSVKCEACGSRRTFVFDITTFFVPQTTAWTR